MTSVAERASTDLHSKSLLCWRASGPRPARAEALRKIGLRRDRGADYGATAAIASTISRLCDCRVARPRTSCVRWLMAVRGQQALTSCSR